MPLPPLGDCNLQEQLITALDRLDRLNGKRGSGRVENLDFCDFVRFGKDGFRFFLKSWDYIYSRERLTALQGNRYKDKRWSLNRFIRENRAEVRSFVPEDLHECLTLYDEWKNGKENEDSRKPAGEGDYSRFLMEDSRIAHERMMKEAPPLGLTGLVVSIEGRIKAYAFGFSADAEMAVVLAEITDRSIPGLPQFIFREFCGLFPDAVWINAMDDSDLPLLRKTKMSYHPVLLAPSFTVTGVRNGEDS